MPKTYTPEEINQAKSELKLALTDHKATVKNLGLSQKAVDKAVKVVQKAEARLGKMQPQPSV